MPSDAHRTARRPSRLVPVAVAVVATGCGGGGHQAQPPPGPAAALHVSIAGVAPGGTLPRSATCAGAGHSPALSWSRPPSGTRALALVVTDPDAPSGTFTHWTVWNVSPGDRGFSAGAAPSGSRQGRNSTGRLGWTPPCPPPGDPPHRYVFTVVALRRTLPLAAGAPPAAVQRALAAAVVARGRAVARFGR